MAELTTHRYPCPCCGYRVHETPGEYEICPICYWEDDPVQLRWPQYPGGANHETLIEAQRNFRTIGASEERVAHLTRDPVDGETVDPGFRPVDPDGDDLESPDGEPAPWPASRTALYWWRSTYWRR